MRKKYNTSVQNIHGVGLRLIVYTESHFAKLKAKRFMIMGPDGKTSRQNLWIPNSCLLEDGTINPDKDITWLLRQPTNQHKFELAKVKVNGGSDVRKGAVD